MRPDPTSEATQQTAARKRRLSVMAKAPTGRLEALWVKLGPAPEHTVLRPPEVGTVMVRGRAGATGAAFNLGEMSVTRCSVRLESGAVGHGYVQGRSKTAARIAALADAMAEDGQGARIEADLIVPLSAEIRARDQTRAEKAAATKVEFFTMARERT